MRYWYNVIEGELYPGKLLTAILTLILVSKINIGSRERNLVPLAGDSNVAEQSQYRGKL